MDKTQKADTRHRVLVQNLTRKVPFEVIFHTLHRADEAGEFNDRLASRQHTRKRAC